MDQTSDRCDILDVLEESATTGGAVRVHALDQEFVDRVQDVVTQNGEDFAHFLDHGRVPVSNISSCERA
jgi:hypothetical protein